MNYKDDIIVFDLETIKGFFLACFYIPDTEQFIKFRVNKNKNDLFDFIDFIKNNTSKYFVGYNTIGFDGQVVQFIFDNYSKWVDLDNLQISSLISKFSSDLIENQSYGLFPPYKEENIIIKQIDTPRVWHFFNENKRVSLKQLEFELRSPVIENFEVEPDNLDFTDEEITDLEKYCENDVINTFRHFLYTIGETDHILYKGKDKIKDREIIMNEVGLPCLNWNDVQIGAEWNKKDYLAMSGREERDLKPKKVNTFYGKKFSTFFPKTVEFQTDKLKKFIKEFGNTPVLNEKQEFKYTFNSELTVTLAKGGIHSNELPRYIEPEKGYLYIQIDVGSQYPNYLRKSGKFPKHLGREWNEMLKGKIQRRLNYKKLFGETKDPKYNSLQEMGKLSLNGGALNFCI